LTPDKIGFVNMENDGWTSDKHLFDVMVRTRKFLKKLDAKFNKESETIAKSKSEDDSAQGKTPEEVQMDAQFYQYNLRMVQKRLLEETQRYAALQDEVLETRDRMIADKKRIEKIKEKLRFICSMTKEANEWMDSLATSENSKTNI